MGIFKCVLAAFLSLLFSDVDVGMLCLLYVKEGIEVIANIVEIVLYLFSHIIEIGKVLMLVGVFLHLLDLHFSKPLHI